MYEPPKSAADIPTIEQLVAAMDVKVAGLADTKRRLALLLRRHGIAGVLGRAVHPPNCLVVGPSGGGKTLLIRSALEAFPAPWVQGTITAYTDTGYEGQHLPSLYGQLAVPAWRDRGGERPAPVGEHVPIVERFGVVVLDEFDKIRANFNQSASGPREDARNRALQAELLTLVEGTSVDTGHFRLRTDGILHIGVGAFQGLGEFVAAHIEKDNPGHSASIPPRQLHLHAIEEDYVAYGFLEELIGRFATVIDLPPLDTQQMVNILHEQIIPHYEQEFLDYGVGLMVDDGAMHHLANQATLAPVGARALRPLLEAALWRSWSTAEPGDVVHLGAAEAISENAQLIKGGV